MTRVLSPSPLGVEDGKKKGPASTRAYTANVHTGGSVGSAKRSNQLRENIIGAWRSPVARLLWEQEVAGSNPAAPTRGARGSAVRSA